jgi:hypothetical protein
MTSVLSIGITAGNVPENGTVTFTLSNLRTPRSIRGEQTAWLNTRSAVGGLVHGPTAVLISPVTYGALATTGSEDGLAWLADITTPGVTSMANVSFQTKGALVTGSSVLLTMPCGWHMPSNPTIIFHEPSGLVASAAVFSATASGYGERLSQLVVTLASTIVSSSDDTTSIVLEFADVSMTVLEVTTPNQIQTDFQGRLYTRAPFALCDQSSSSGTCTASDALVELEHWPGSNLSACVVDGPTAVTFSATAVATYTLSWHGAFIPLDDTDTAEPAYIVSDSPSPHIQVAVRNDRGGPHVTGEGTEFAQVSCILSVETVDGATVDSDAVLGEPTVAELVGGVATFPARSFDVPLGAVVTVSAQCLGATNDAGVFVSVGGVLQARSYMLVVTIPAAAYVFGSSLSGDPTNFIPSIELALSTDGDMSIPSSPYALGIGANATECDVSVAVSPTATASNKVVTLLNDPANHRTSEGGRVMFDQLALFAGDKPEADRLYSEGQSSSDDELSPGGLLMAPLLANQSAVFFTFDCFWGGNRHKPLPTIGGYSTAMTEMGAGPATDLSSTVQHLTVDWVARPPDTIQSAVGIGDCNPLTSVDTCAGSSAPMLAVRIHNHTGLAHEGQPLVKCKISFWEAVVMGERVIINGAWQTGSDENFRPQLRGVTAVETNNKGEALFSPLNIKTELGSSVVLRLLCFSSNWLPPLYTQTMKVGSIVAQWHQTPPKMILLGSLGVANTFMETYMDNSTGNDGCGGKFPCTVMAPMSIKWWDLDKDTRYVTGEDCARCCTVAVKGSYFPYKKIVDQSEKDSELVSEDTYQLIEGAVASVVDGIATFDELVVGKHAQITADNLATWESSKTDPTAEKTYDDTRLFNQRLEFRVSCNFNGDKDLKMTELYWPNPPSALDPTSAVLADVEDEDWWAEQYSQVQPVRALLTAVPEELVKIKLPLDDASQNVKQKFDLALQKQLLDGQWVTMGTNCSTGPSQTWCHDKTTTCTALVDSKGPNWKQDGAALGGDTANKKSRFMKLLAGGTFPHLSDYRVSFTDLVFSKTTSLGPDANWGATYQFDGIGKTVSVSFMCEGAVRLARVFHDVQISGCIQGEEPSRTQDDCVTCDQHSFNKIGQSTMCHACPVREFRGETSFITWDAAQANAAHTFCECRFQYMAVRDSESYANNASYALAVDNGKHWGKKCLLCPDGAVCDKVGVTFDSVQASEGYWQDKDFFKTANLKNSKGLVESQLTFKKCASSGSGTSACLGGDYSADKITCESRPCNCYGCLQMYNSTCKAESEDGTLAGYLNGINRTNTSVSYLANHPSAGKEECFDMGLLLANASTDACSRWPGMPEGTLTMQPCQGCAVHHIGHLCANCEVGYKKNASELCEICPEDTGGTMMGIYITLGLGFGFLGMCFFFMRRIRAMIDRAQEKAVAIFEAQVLKSGIATDEELQDFEDNFELYYLYDVYIRKVKVFISFFQVVSAFLGNFKLIEWPQSVRNLFGKFQVVNLNPFQAQALACASDITFADVFLISTLYPLVICAGIFLFHLFSKHILKSGPFVKNDLVYKLCLMIIFLVYPATSNLILKMLVCEDFDNGSSYLAADLTIRCDPLSDGTYEQVRVLGTFMGYDTLKSLALFMIAVYPVGFPLICLLTLYWVRNDLFERRFDIGQLIDTEEYGEGMVHEIDEIPGPKGILRIYTIHFEKLHPVRVATNAHLPGTRNKANLKSTRNLITADEDGPFPRIDGIIVAYGDQVLVRNQEFAADNGIYTVSSMGDEEEPWMLVRSTGSDTGPAINGSGAFVREGKRWINKAFVLSCSTSATLELNVTPLEYKLDTAGAIPDDETRLRAHSTNVPLFVMEKVRLVAEQVFPLEGVTNSAYLNEKGHFCVPNPEWQDKLGVLYDGYEPEYWYWEVIEMIRKLLLVGLIVFILPDTANQMAVGCILALIMIILNAAFAPYVDPDDDRLNLACSVAIWAGYFGGFMLCFKKYEGPDFDLGGDTFGMVIVGVNLMPLFVGLYLLGKVFAQPACRLARKMWAATYGDKDHDKHAKKGALTLWEEGNNPGLEGTNVAGPATPRTQSRMFGVDRVSIKNVETTQHNPMMAGGTTQHNPMAGGATRKDTMDLDDGFWEGGRASDLRNGPAETPVEPLRRISKGADRSADRSAERSAGSILPGGKDRNGRRSTATVRVDAKARALSMREKLHDYRRGSRAGSTVHQDSMRTMLTRPDSAISKYEMDHALPAGQGLEVGGLVRIRGSPMHAKSMTHAGSLAVLKVAPMPGSNVWTIALWGRGHDGGVVHIEAQHLMVIQMDTHSGHAAGLDPHNHSHIPASSLQTARQSMGGRSAGNVTSSAAVLALEEQSRRVVAKEQGLAMQQPHHKNSDGGERVREIRERRREKREREEEERKREEGKDAAGAGGTRHGRTSSMARMNQKWAAVIGRKSSIKGTGQSAPKNKQGEQSAPKSKMLAAAEEWAKDHPHGLAPALKTQQSFVDRDDPVQHARQQGVGAGAEQPVHDKKKAKGKVKGENPMLFPGMTMPNKRNSTTFDFAAQASTEDLGRRYSEDEHVDGKVMKSLEQFENHNLDAEMGHHNNSHVHMPISTHSSSLRNLGADGAETQGEETEEEERFSSHTIRHVKSGAALRHGQTTAPDSPVARTIRHVKSGAALVHGSANQGPDTSQYQLDTKTHTAEI